MPHYLTLTVVAATCLIGSAIAGSDSPTSATIAPAPPGEKLSDDFELSIDSQAVPVYSCRVSAIPFNQVWPGYQRPLEQTELASFAYWDMSGPVEVEVVCHRPIESVVIRPLSLGIQAKVDDDRIRFRLPKPRPLCVEVNGTHHVLHLFASVPQGPSPDAQSPGMRYFGPGVHHPGRITLTNNETVYIAAGAVVYGEIEAVDASNIRIFGRGILDASNISREQGAGCIRLINCRNILVDGLVLRDPNQWCLGLFSCADAKLSDLKLVGLWRYNADGIDVCDSQNVSIRDCFVRAFDDCIVLKGIVNKAPVKQVVVDGCTLWNDWGRAIEIGAETATPEISDVTFSDCDILRATHIAMDIQHGDNAMIRNILFDKIRVEVEDVNLLPQLQQTPAAQYQQDANHTPKLLVLEIRKNVYSKSPSLGAIEQVAVRDIRVIGKSVPASSIAGFDADHTIRDVAIENLRFDGRTMKSAAEASIDIGPFVEDLRFVVPQAAP